MIQTDLVINARYRVLRTLGAGGMGTVYAAHDERLGRQVALKLLRHDLARDQRARERFLREAQIAAQLVHPHIVRTYDVGDSPEGPYLVQELLAGVTLDQRLPLPVPQAVQVAAAVADALSYIHQRGYVHCDVKPQNIMLLGDDANPRVVLLDFGIARVAGTDTTTLIATPHYLAPERAMGQAPTAAADLYALGIVLFHMIAGHPPFEAPTLHTIIEQHRTQPVPALSGAIPAAQPLDAIIARLTAKQPANRYASASALRADLDALGSAAPHAQPTLVVPLASYAAATRAVAPAKPWLAPTNHRALGRRFLLLPLIFGAVLLGAMLLRAMPAATTGTASPPAAASAPAPPSAAASAPALPSSASAAPAPVLVPAVVGLPLADAQQQLAAAGLQGTPGDIVASDQPAGVVVGTEPAAQQAVPPGTSVVLFQSAGPPPAAPPPAEAKDTKKDDQKDTKEDDQKERKENEEKRKGRDKDDD